MSVNFWDEDSAVAMTGGEAAAYAMKQVEPGVVPIYPITPQTPIVEKFADYLADGKIDTEIIPTESEHSVMSAAVGAAASGVRTMTATSSAGLALMHEILGVASGLRVPIVMNVVNRALSSPINIHCDHSDSMGAREMGWIQIYSESAQEVYDHNLLAVKISENKDVLLPVMVMQDGFLTSHLLENIEILPDGEVKKFVGKYSYPYSLLKSEKALTVGALMLYDNYFETKHLQHQAMEEARKVYKTAAKELSKITERDYPEIETFKVGRDTEAVIVVSSSSAGTAREVAAKLNMDGHKVGVVKVRLFRPFPYKELENAIKNVENIAVLDRALSFGSTPPLFSEVSKVICDMKEKSKKDYKAQSYVFGLGGRDLREEDIEKVYAEMLGRKFTEEIKFLNLSQV